MMADADDEAIANLARNEGKPKCPNCNGTGKVVKYVRPRVDALVNCVSCQGTGESEITQTHFSENWAVEQVAQHVTAGIAGWAAVPHILKKLPVRHRRSAFNAIKIAYMLHLIELDKKMFSDQFDYPFTDDEVAMCPHTSQGEPLVWARVKR